MINLSSLASSIKDIDPAWTFSHYCNVPQSQFNGSTIKIKSIFQPEEKTASMVLYHKDAYKFNCFSTAQRGDHINLVERKFELNYSQSCAKIIRDHAHSMGAGTGVLPTTIDREKYKIKGFITRPWSVSDRAYFLAFGIGVTALEWAGVKPLSKYQLHNGTDEIIIQNEAMYGYFSKKGKLYKIYQPTRTDFKFLVVDSAYDFGKDHLEGNKYFGILSSVKDAMAFKALGLSIDIKVPSSENAHFSEEYMKALSKKYKSGFTLLDNDRAGLAAMAVYKQKYGINQVWLQLSKDYSDSQRDHGKAKVRDLVIPLIHKAIN